MNTANKSDEMHEVEKLVKLVKNKGIVYNICFEKDRYSAMNIMPHMLTDLKRFCVDDDGVFTVDTTFQVADGLWLTDSTYPYKALIDGNGKHPKFPGPSQWHWKKDTESYRRYMGETCLAKSELRNIRNVGHDLDAAIACGLNDVLNAPNHFWCTEHLQEADTRKLRKLNANNRTVDRVMADIYVTQNENVLEFGLADAEDENDLLVKLESLESTWESLVPSFYTWFKKCRFEGFVECLVLSARESKGIKGRYYSNGLELKHRLLKRNLVTTIVELKLEKFPSTLKNGLLKTSSMKLTEIFMDKENTD
ncbi:uncharacterized protein LOC130624337 [Hydractinia symbiolongicarpus]|uniref:uncharacterized protein LOC130624337 n=1 Tax=Hydractinia symbiolongicarpus TaxID=13093 RepID=UPI00254E655E|nr:uncharacterized protein LOC130624337 [Hydractinia symbiolongicarpus]